MVRVHDVAATVQAARLVDEPVVDHLLDRAAG
jgi:hypothetical protein